MATKKPIVKRPPKTLKERRFVKELINNGGNQVQAALVAYDTDNYTSASVIAHENIEKLRIPDLLDLQGVTDECLVADLKEGLKSWKRVGSPTEPDSLDPDFSVRHKWWVSAMQLKGHLQTSQDINFNANSITFQVSRSSS